MRLVQLSGMSERRVAVVEEPSLHLLRDCATVAGLAAGAAASGQRLAERAADLRSGTVIPYEPVYRGESGWSILPAIDHPEEPARCLVSGTGLTHMASAKNRDAMHGDQASLTDSMKMYRWGVEGGKPAPGTPGVSPEWFYKGTGTTLRGHLGALTVPSYSDDGGEEPEIAAVYWIDSGGIPRRLGFAIGNEFSDHEFEKRNYLYLASSKLRECAIGPELVLDLAFDTVPGEVAVSRGGQLLWRKDIRSGEGVMCHSLANIEHHHFKFAPHRRPGDVHVHFLGADAFSFGDGIRLEDGDQMSVRFQGLGRALVNRVVREPRTEEVITAVAL